MRGTRRVDAESSTPFHVLPVPRSRPRLLRLPTSTSHSRVQIEMAAEPQTLRGLFLKGEQAKQELAASYEPNSPTFQENLSKTIATYEECQKLAEHVSLFSPNETLEDIVSTDLQYVARHVFCLPKLAAFPALAAAKPL
jgi:hypothetical protein